MKMNANFIRSVRSCTSAEASLVQNNASAGTPPAVCTDAAAKIVPIKAKAIPTEQMIRYFHIASNERRLGCSDIRKALKRVVASIPTHMMPRLLETRTSIIAVSEPSQSAPKRCATARVKPCSPASPCSPISCAK
jgi:hypothetical protein